MGHVWVLRVREGLDHESNVVYFLVSNGGLC